MKLHVFHRTRFAYGAPVRESFNEARLQPLNGPSQACQLFTLKVVPVPRQMIFQDFYGNTVHQFEIPQQHSELVVEAHSDVLTRDEPVLVAGDTPGPVGPLTPQAHAERCYDYLQPSTYVDVTSELTQLARDVSGGSTDAWQTAQALMAYIHREFHYQPASTNAHTHMREVLQSRTGVCQDFAHVLVGLCRSLQIPTRYVSGYLYNGPADKLKGAQASHAWVEVYIGRHGWLGLDPTNDHIVSGQHVKIAVGRDYADVPPVKGTYRGTGRRTLTVEVLVTETENSVLAPG